VVAPPQSNLYRIHFRPRQTRKQYYSAPQKGKGRVRYQVNEELQGFHKGDRVLVKGASLSSSTQSTLMGISRSHGERRTSEGSTQDCKILERARTILWEAQSTKKTPE